MQHKTAYHTVKTVLILGNSIPIPEIIEKIVSMDHTYKTRNLFSNPHNWIGIEQEINDCRTTGRLLAVLMFLTEGALLHSSTPEYGEVWHDLITAMKLANSLVFVPSYVLKGEFHNDSIEKVICKKKGINLNTLDVFRRKHIKKDEVVSKSEMNALKEDTKSVIEMIKASGIEIVPYEKDKSFTIRAYPFLDDADDGVFLKLYIPHGRYQADQFASFVVDPGNWRVPISIVNMVDSLAREGSHGKAQALRRRIEDENRPRSAQRATNIGTDLPRV